MSSINDLYDKIQMLGEAKSAGYAKQAPVFKDVPKKMKAAGMAASSRDAMIFITQVLSRLDIIEPDIYEMAIKGQHKERMEKLMTILRSKEEEINAKSDEIVEYINQNLDNYTAGAGTDRNRAEKYKETAKAMSQEVQNIKAGKEADDALRDIAVAVSQGLDSDVTDEDIAALDFDEADIFINIPDANVKGEVAKKVADYLNGQGLKAEPTRAGVNIEAPTGFFGDNAMHAKFEDQLKGLVMRTDSNIGEDKIQVKFTGADGPVEVEDAEGLTSQTQVDAGDRLSAMYRKDMLANIQKAHESMVGDGTDLTTGTKFSEAEIADLYKQAAEQNLSKYKRINKQSNGKQQDRVDVAQSILDDVNKTQAANKGASVEDAEGKHDDNDGKEERCDYVPCEDEEVVAENKYTTSDSLLDIYSNVKPIVETIVESTTVNENGQTSHTQQYIVEKAEAAIEQVYTNEYLTEQKASDSLLVPKEEVRESFKERYQPKTSYQLEELRRYGL